MRIRSDNFYTARRYADEQLGTSISRGICPKSKGSVASRAYAVDPRASVSCVLPSSLRMKRPGRTWTRVFL
eukprot:2678696-Pyramimonas_sp.AAC.1